VLADSAAAYPSTGSRVKVWSPGVRILHWLLTLGLIISYLTADDAMRLHFWVGHGILTLVLVRALIGLYGSHHVRFETFVPTPRELLRYFGDLRNGTARRYLGHDPAGGAMIATLLTIVLLTVASGLATYYVPALEEASEEVHEVLATLTLVLVIVHVIGVSVASYLQRENLIGGMISGWKRDPVEPKTALDTRTATRRNRAAARG
jgi:cytochrome b